MPIGRYPRRFIGISFVFGLPDWELEQRGDTAESPEQLLERLEDALDQGLITIEEVQQLLADQQE